MYYSTVVAVVIVVCTQYVCTIQYYINNTECYTELLPQYYTIYKHYIHTYTIYTYTIYTYIHTLN